MSVDRAGGGGDWTPVREGAAESVGESSGSPVTPLSVSSISFASPRSIGEMPSLRGRVAVLEPDALIDSSQKFQQAAFDLAIVVRLAGLEKHLQTMDPPVSLANKDLESLSREVEALKSSEPPALQGKKALLADCYIAWKEGDQSLSFPKFFIQSLSERMEPIGRELQEVEDALSALSDSEGDAAKGLKERKDILEGQANDLRGAIPGADDYYPTMFYLLGQYTDEESFPELFKERPPEKVDEVCGDDFQLSGIYYSFRESSRGGEEQDSVNRLVEEGLVLGSGVNIEEAREHTTALLGHLEKSFEDLEASKAAERAPAPQSGDRTGGRSLSVVASSLSRLARGISLGLQHMPTPPFFPRIDHRF